MVRSPSPASADPRDRDNLHAKKEKAAIRGAGPQHSGEQVINKRGTVRQSLAKVMAQRPDGSVRVGDGRSCTPCAVPRQQCVIRV